MTKTDSSFCLIDPSDSHVLLMSSLNNTGMSLPSTFSYWIRDKYNLKRLSLLGGFACYDGQGIHSLLAAECSEKKKVFRKSLFSLELM